jgi:hypothetical protein
MVDRGVKNQRKKYKVRKKDKNIKGKGMEERDRRNRRPTIHIYEAHNFV